MGRSRSVVHRSGCLLSRNGCLLSRNGCLVAGAPVAGPVVAGPVVAGAVVAGAVGGSAGEDGTVPALVADAPAGCRAHWRSRGIDANSRASMAPTVMMTSTTSGVRTMDSHTTLPAKTAAHRYMIRTLVRCERPISSMR